MQTGLYCHIPFCVAPATFVLFVGKTKRADLLSIWGMESEFERIPKSVQVDTVFWEGAHQACCPQKIYSD